MSYRDETKEINIGGVKIGHGNPIAIQSMTNTKTADVSSTVAQIHALEKAGCEIIRCTVPDEASAKAIAEIKKQISIPLVADIHFDYRIALACAENGIDKIRINPGNIGGEEKGLGAMYGLISTPSGLHVEYVTYAKQDTDLVLQLSLGNCAAPNTIVLSKVSVERAGKIIPVSDTIYTF